MHTKIARPPRGHAAWHARLRREPPMCKKYGNSGGNSWAIPGNSGPCSAIRSVREVMKREETGNSLPRKETFIILYRGQCIRETS